MPNLERRISAALGDAAQQLVVSLDGGIAAIQLARPDKHNAISYAMWSAFAALMPVLAAADEVDVVLFRGSPGGPFSAGADIAEFQTLRSEPVGARRYSDAVEAGERAVIEFPKPTVAKIRGFCFGGGMGLALALERV